MENKWTHIQSAVNFCDLIRTTLGPKGMNKGVLGKDHIFTNDGATIINSIDSDEVIIQLFKELAVSQENLIGDGTTTSIILAGQLLDNALSLLNRGIHPTTIINGYSTAKIEVLKKLNELKEEGSPEQIIDTAFGSKISPDLKDSLKKLILQVSDYELLKIHKVQGNEPELFNGHVFGGYTINDRMKSKISGKIAILDFRTHVEAADLKISQVDELKKINNYEREYKRNIVDSLVSKQIDCLFYTDTNPEFETYLTEKGITGIVVYQRDEIDQICRALNVKVTSDLDEIYSVDGEIEYKKPNQIFIKGSAETLILKGETKHITDELERSVHDVISLLKHEIDQVTGAGAIEIELGRHLREFSEKIGGKEQIAIEKFAESIESIPLIIAENCGLDAMHILTSLKTLHKESPHMGVDINKGIDDAKKNGIVEPVLVKIYAINSAVNTANLLLKTDKLLTGKK